jgi:hypothetical protein
MPAAAQLGVAAAVAASHVHCIRKPFAAVSLHLAAPSCLRYFWACARCRPVDLPKDGQATPRQALQLAGALYEAM